MIDAAGLALVDRLIRERLSGASTQIRVQNENL